ncbi:DUF1501 domain-containing protein [Urbifossiella limnaea]|uniref:DUF1501 domain-containing protein n=1 Tax=Urbifossiella limnaea TaxID=2528023 RepID=A0A517XQH9_9BACT|nr:DUF1501 domain-containing protein [Urbifossiella limnaea]QDU19765.1 hypothetical protein ETAA1_17020 [Urbifossiella limnaea]
MKPIFESGACTSGHHLSRRSLMTGLLTTAGGAAVANWGALVHSATIAAEAKRSGKRCIMLYMEGGASQTDTFDMKPGRRTAGPFRPIPTNVTGIQVCEFLPCVARHADKLAIIRSMRTQSVDHGIGGYHMHTCYPSSQRFPHPEIGAMIAKYCQDPEADLPSFVKIGPTSGVYGSGYLGPQYEPFVVAEDGKLPGFASPSAPPEVQARRGELLNFMEQRFAEHRPGEPFASHRTAELRTVRLMRARQAFDVSREWDQAKDRYGDTKFGRGCFTALKLVEAGVSFVEVGQYGHDTHVDNFPISKALYSVLDPAWGGLMDDLARRGLLSDTLVVWTSEFGRTPAINNRAGRDHFGRAWTVVLAGGGINGGRHHGASDPDGFEVQDDPVTEGDYFATIYTALGINPRARHFLGSRPIWATPEGSRPIRQLLG